MDKDRWLKTWKKRDLVRLFEQKWPRSKKFNLNLRLSKSLRCGSQAGKQNQVGKVSTTRVQIHFSLRSGITAPGCRKLSEEAGLWAHGVGGGAARFVVCIRNQRPPLLEWEADVSEEFSWLQQIFFFFHAWALSAASLPLSVSLFPLCVYGPSSSSVPFLMLWHMLYLKLFLNQRGGDRLLHWLTCLHLLQAGGESFFFGFNLPAVGHGDSVQRKQ